MALRAPRGTKDLLGRKAEAWHFMQLEAVRFFATYGYRLIETPTFEQLDVFVRGIGQATDVVGKEMYFVNSKQDLEGMAAGGPQRSADKQLALRPEMTAGVARAIVENNLVPPDGVTVKFVYAASMYRHERPQLLRLREFHQIGAECVGAAEPSADAEIIIMLMQYFERIGIPREKMRLLINSMGDDDCRPTYRESVRNYLLAHEQELCEECVRRADTNPLRAFDCKDPGCRSAMEAAPKITDSLCGSCSEHYQSVKSLLDAAGVVYTEDARLVRGLDYYTRTVFEVQVDDGLGAQSAIGGGGRYDKLIEEFGGKPTPGLGFALGFERMFEVVMATSGDIAFEGFSSDVYVAAVDDSVRAVAFDVAQKLRALGIATELDHQKRSLKSQFKQAGKADIGLVIIVGPDELAGNVVKLRNMASKEEYEVALDEVAAHVQEMIQVAGC